MSKNIVILVDGTGQDGSVKYPSNISKLYQMLEISDKQMALYIPGVGSGWKKLTGNAFGNGTSNKILECYKFLCDNYTPGDKIYLFGFSRGAAIVRSLSGFINLMGIMNFLFAYNNPIMPAYDIYSIKDEEKRNKKAAICRKKFTWRARQNRHYPEIPRIKFLGVWDTVSALATPNDFLNGIIDKIPAFKHSFHNFKLCENVENAYQALAIDEERKAFAPLIWDSHIRKGQTMEQVWFKGSHTDIGGGYKEAGLSDITLEWMVNNATDNGLLINPNHTIKINPDTNDIMHDPLDSWWARLLYKKEPRLLDKLKYHISTIQ